jgi:hypothetical protein
MARKPSPFKRSTCTICRHHDRALIEASRIAGCSLDAVAAKYEASRDAIARHMANHVSDDDRAQYLAEQPLKELAERAAKENLSLLEYLALVRSLLMQETQLAALCHDRHGLASVSGRLLETLKAIGSLTGEIARLAPGTVINNTAVFVGSPAFAALHEMLLLRLSGYPEALAAVLEGLRELAAQDAPALPPAITLEAQAVPA